MINWINFCGILLINASVMYVLYSFMTFLQRNPIDKINKYKDEHLSNYYYPVLPYNYDSWVSNHLKIQNILKNKKIDIFDTGKLNKIFYMLFTFSYIGIIFLFSLSVSSNLSFFLIFGFGGGFIFSLMIFMLLAMTEFIINVIYDKKITPILTKMLALLIDGNKNEFLSLYNQQNKFIKWCAKHCFSKHDLFKILLIHKELSLTLELNESQQKVRKVRKI